MVAAIRLSALQSAQDTRLSWGLRLRAIGAAISGRPVHMTPQQVVRLAAGSFRAAENPRRRWRTFDGSGDYHLDDLTRQNLRIASRDLERNDDLYDSLLTNWTTYLVGSGPRPVFASSNPAFNDAATALFAAHVKQKRLDGRRLFHWAEWVALLARAIARDGDAGVAINDDGSGTIFESERITDVILDRASRITGFRLADLSTSGLLLAGHDTPVIPADRFKLSAYRSRPSQTRGHPVLSAGLDDWERIGSLREAEVIAAEAASLPWLVISSQPNTQNPVSAIGAGKNPNVTGPTPPSGWQRTDAGSILGLPPGLDGKPWSPERPNLDVPEFVKQMLRGLCAPLMPYEVAFLDIGDLNYAAIRGLGKLAQRKLADFRTRHLDDPITAVISAWARCEILRGALPFTADYTAFALEWDALEIRDREKDAAADEKELANGTTDLAELLGPEWKKRIDRRAEVRDYLRGKGLPIPGSPDPAAPVPAPAPPISTAAVAPRNESPTP